jgi:hypothetical protein
MLEGSRCVGARKAETADVDSVRCIPQYHGPVREAVDRLACARPCCCCRVGCVLIAAQTS